MAVIERRIRIYVCDRCAETHEVEGAAVFTPAGWERLLYGQDIGPVLAAAHSTTELGKQVSPTLLCTDCASWLRKFLEGRKVAD